MAVDSKKRRKAALFMVKGKSPSRKSMLTQELSSENSIYCYRMLKTPPNPGTLSKGGK